MGGPGTPGGTKPKVRRAQGGRVVESRYLQLERRGARKAPAQAPAADQTLRTSRAAEPGKKPAGPQRNRDPRDLHSTLLEGHGATPPDLDVSAINDRGLARRTPRPWPDRTVAGKPEGGSFSEPQRKEPDPDMMESQTLLFTLLTLKMENSLVSLEAEAERRLLAACGERARLERRARELGRRRLLGRRARELDVALDVQVELLTPCVALSGRFAERYRSLAAALDSTRHELPVRGIHSSGDGRGLLDALQAELGTTRDLLAELGLGPEGHSSVLTLLAQLRAAAGDKDQELRRAWAQVLELSSEASQEAALLNQDAWESACGPGPARRWYFGPSDLHAVPAAPCASP